MIIKLRIIVSVLVLILCLNASGQQPRVLYKKHRSIPSDSIWIEIYKNLYSHDNLTAKSTYDSISQLYLENENYSGYMFLSNEYSYWLRLMGGKSQYSADFLENSLNTVINKLPDNNFELLYAYYNLILHTIDLKEKLIWCQMFFMVYDNIFPNNELVNFSVNVHMTCGVANYHIGNIEEAWLHWDYSRAHMNEIRDPLWVIKRIASTVKMSQPETALPLLKYVYDNMMGNTKNWHKIFTVTGNYIVQLNRVEDYERTIEYGEKGLVFFDDHLEDIKKGMRPHAVIHLALIDAYMETGSYDKAFEVMGKTYAVLDQLAYKGQTISALNDDKKIWFSKNGMLDSAFVYLNKAYEIDLEKKTDPEYIVYNYMDNSIQGYLKQYGNFYAYKQKYQKALNYYKRALRASNMKHYSHIDDTTYLIPPKEFRGINTESVMITFNRLQECYIDLYKENSDTALLYEMIDYCNYGNAILKEQFKTLVDKEMVFSISEMIKANNSYGLFACAELSKSNSEFIDSAFIYADMSRSFSLNYLMQIKNRTTSDEEDALILEVSQLSIDLANRQTTGDTISIELVDLILDLLRAKMLLGELTNYESKIIDFKPDIASIKKGLMGNSAILEYFLADSVLYAICYMNGSSELKTIAVPNMADEIRKLKRNLKSGNFNTDQTKMLYSYLFAPFEHMLTNANKLSILLDEQLSEIPLEILVDSENQSLINKYAIQYYNSAKNMGQKTQINPKSLFAIAPVFSNNNTFISENISRSIIDSSEIFNVRESSSCLSPIIYSLEEVLSIGKRSTEKGIETIVLSMTEATESAFKQQVKGKDIIHIATHGISRSEFKSGLFFTYNEKENDDGFLRLPELYKMNIHADLVVLSACKTATGEIQEGEGVIALPRGFIYAGVPNVIASLWKIHDEKTKDLMVAFYKHLLEDKVSYAEALRLAKLDCIEKGFFPLDWAGFILIGN